MFYYSMVVTKLAWRDLRISFSGHRIYPINVGYIFGYI